MVSTTMGIWQYEQKNRQFIGHINGNGLTTREYVLGSSMSIKAAKENAKINNVDNVEFIAGDVEKALSNIIYDRKIIPDIVMVDPPRRGLDNTSINNILSIKSKRLVYISCNPATLVRDLAKLEEMYEVKEIVPVDMFPFTSHVECCSVLYLKDSIQ